MAAAGAAEREEASWRRCYSSRGEKLARRSSAVFIGFALVRGKQGGVNTAKEIGEFGDWGLLSSIFAVWQQINCLASFVASCTGIHNTGRAAPLKNHNVQVFGGR